MKCRHLITGSRQISIQQQLKGVTPLQHVPLRHFFQAFRRRFSEKGAHTPKTSLLRPLFE